MSPPVEELLTLNWTDDALVNSRLVELSNLKSDGLKRLGQVWAKIEPEMRRQIVSRLVELADDHIELNFDSIFTSCLKDPSFSELLIFPYLEYFSKYSFSVLSSFSKF